MELTDDELSMVAGGCDLGYGMRNGWGTSDPPRYGDLSLGGDYQYDASQEPTKEIHII